MGHDKDPVNPQAGSPDNVILEGRVPDKLLIDRRRVLYLIQVMAGFLDRLQDTVNSMLQRAVTRCTRSLNTCLEEGDLSNLELLLGRSHREMQRCRFYLRIRFLPPDFVRELDRQTLSETGRFWAELRGALADMAEETGNSDIYDILYYVDRLIKKDRQNGQL